MPFKLSLKERVSFGICWKILMYTGIIIARKEWQWLNSHINKRLSPQKKLTFVYKKEFMPNRMNDLVIMDNVYI
jgi:hypothetical protein